MNEYGDSFVNTSFLWFTGVIEDINDPEEMGRYRVRCFGYHTEIKESLKTEDLPWANVMLPVTSASTSGIGYSATGLVQGSWVIGFFRDGKNAQDPVIMGSIPSMSEERPKYNVGFSDPDKKYPLSSTIRKPDTPQPARKDYKESEGYKKKQSYANRVNCDWDLNNLSKVSPKYPYNHVYRSESGHVIEIDDTKGSERISLQHKSGTFFEITESGDGYLVIDGNGYEVILENRNIYIKGNVTTCVDGNSITTVKGDYVLSVSGNMTTSVGGNQTLSIGGEQTVAIGGEQTIMAKQTNILNKVVVSVDVEAGSNKVSLIGHKHRDSVGVKAGITTKPL